MASTVRIAEDQAEGILETLRAVANPHETLPELSRLPCMRPDEASLALVDAVAALPTDSLERIRQVISDVLSGNAVQAPPPP